jgi:hypothetical protein
MFQTNAPKDRTIPVMLDMGVCMSKGERERRRRFDDLKRFRRSVPDSRDAKLPLR